MFFEHSELGYTILTEELFISCLTEDFFPLMSFSSLCRYLPAGKMSFDVYFVFIRAVTCLLVGGHDDYIIS